MALLLRANLRGSFRLTSLPPLHLLERHDAKLPGILVTPLAKRWYGESAALEDFSTPSQTSNEALGIPKMVDQLETTMQVDMPDKEYAKAQSGSAEAVSFQKEMKEESSKQSRDSLTDFILSKFKPVGGNGNTKREVEMKAAGQVPVNFDDRRQNEKKKWEDVIESIRGLSARTKPETGGNILSGGKGDIFDKKGRRSEDDFLDLDLPEDGSEGTSPLGSSNNPNRCAQLMESFKKHPSPNLRPKEGGSPFGWNNQRPTEKASLNFKSPNTAPRVELPDKVVPRVDDANPRFEETAPRSVNDVSQPKGHVVCIQNLPSCCNLALVRDALSHFGTVTGSFRRPNPNGLCACFVEFQTEDGMEDALAARWLLIEGKTFPIIRTDRPVTTVVRLSRVSPDTSESQILFTCGRYGSLDTIRKRGNGVFDVFYKLNEMPNICRIMDSLSEVKLNHNRWVALPAPLVHPGARKGFLKSKDGQAWHLSQMNRALRRIELALETATVALEDLKVLNSLDEQIQGPPKS